MNLWLILGLAAGATLPIVVAVATVFYGALRQQPADRGVAIAFAKGIGLGVAAGVTVSAIVVALALSLAWLAD